MHPLLPVLPNILDAILVHDVMAEDDRLLPDDVLNQALNASVVQTGHRDSSLQR